MKCIAEFRGSYRWLSNFEYVDVKLNGITYPTTEHAYQAQKTCNEDERRRIAGLSTPGKAKRAGSKVELREGWDDMRVDVMERINRIKYRNSSLRKKLLDTGDAKLVEGNNWGDTFWGVCNGVGSNKLGRILMKIRDEIRFHDDFEDYYKW